MKLPPGNPIHRKKKQTNQYLKIGLIITLVLVIAYFLITAFPNDKPIGGDIDEHGCLIAAGYSWCEPLQKCIRPWEEECIAQDTGEKIAESIARSYVERMSGYTTLNGREIKVTNITQARCIGCWLVELEYSLDSEKDSSSTDSGTASIAIENWQVIDAVFTRGGHTE